MELSIRNATAADAEEIFGLLPRLAQFDIPPRRSPEQLWHGDRDTIAAWARAERPDVHVQVAVDEAQNLLGATVFSLRDELLSHEPSAHLEVIALAPRAEGRGIGTALLDNAERRARMLGALTMTLHVFACNERAVRLYERFGYDGELIRYIKSL